MAAEPTAITAEQAQALLRQLAAINRGDFGYDQLPPDGEGAYGELARGVEELLRLLNGFAGEMTRITRELGSEGRYGGQAEVDGTEESWKHMVENLNHMAYHLTIQVRDFANVTRRYSQGDYSPRATVPCSGETLELLRQINEVGERLQAA